MSWHDAAKAGRDVHGTDATRTIINVNADDLTAGCTAAVNGNQLKTNNAAVAVNTTNIAKDTTKCI